MPESTFLMGMQVTQSPYATTRSKKTELVRHPLRKRRRNWGVKVTWLEAPAIFKLGDHTLVCHPSIYQKLVREFASSHAIQGVSNYG